MYALAVEMLPPEMPSTTREAKINVIPMATLGPVK